LRLPRRNFHFHRERLVWRQLEAFAESICVDLERNSVITAASEEPANVKSCEERNAKQAVLLYMDEFMKEKTIRKGMMENDNVLEGNRHQLAKVGEIGGAKGP
jgi:hypothetical protein